MCVVNQVSVKYMIHHINYNVGCVSMLFCCLGPPHYSLSLMSSFSRKISYSIEKHFPTTKSNKIKLAQKTNNKKVKIRTFTYKFIFGSKMLFPLKLILPKKRTSSKIKLAQKTKNKKVKIKIYMHKIYIWVIFFFL